jgi:hypothetical protein
VVVRNLFPVEDMTLFVVRPEEIEIRKAPLGGKAFYKGKWVTFPSTEEEILKTLGEIERTRKEYNWDNFMDVTYKNLQEELAALRSKTLTGAQAREGADKMKKEEAENPKCPPEALAEAALKDKDALVRAAAAQNPNCPTEALAEAALKDKNALVRRAAAENPKCPPKALAEAAQKDKEALVRLAAVRNSNCPAEALEVAARKDRNKWVRAIAQVGAGVEKPTRIRPKKKGETIERN